MLPYFIKTTEKILYGFGFGLGMRLSLNILPINRENNFYNFENQSQEMLNAAKTEAMIK